MTTLQDDIAILRERVLHKMPLRDSPERDAATRAIRIMTALAKLDAAQVETAIEELLSAATDYELFAATSENGPGWASAAATRRALAEALEASR